MKFSYQWLHEWVNTGWHVDTLCERLNALGLEVEATTPVAGDFSGVLVGEVLSVDPHPNADKLHITRVNVGKGEPLQIVCGAANVRVGMKAPTAVIGATLPGGVTIKETKLRGVPSFGMLCAAIELGIEGQDAGLWELPANLPVGADLRTLLALDDVSIEVSLTPNRADALSLLGIARDIAAFSGIPLQPMAAELPKADLSTKVRVHVEDASACPLYVGCVVEMPTAGVTPLWMQERLRRSGLRSLGLWVDVTNYVMLELGQPMHAFDLEKLHGDLRVGWAQAGEACTLLDGKTVQLSDDMLVIADDRGAIALAGIMGGRETAVNEGTTRVFLEAAHFAPEAVMGRARRLGLHTDSSHRFERGVDPMMPMRAMARALSLLVSIGGARVGSVVQVGSPTADHQPIRLRRTQIRRLLGTEIADSDVVRLLSALGMQVSQQPEGWQVTPPSWRFDIAIEADLVEELARMIGLDQLPKLPLPAASVLPKGRNEQERQLKSLLVARGYQEAITYSFVDAKEQCLVEPEQAALNLANPIADTLGQMRSSLWTGLLAAARYNLNRQVKRLRLFETGLRFLSQTDAQRLPVQIATLAGIACGDAAAMQWGVPARAVDFYDVKGDVEALLAVAGLKNQVRFETASHPALHPGQTAQLLLDDQMIGLMGTLHPTLAEAFDIDVPTVLFTLDLPVLTAKGAISRFQGVSKFPAVRRDIALVVDATVPFAAIQGAVSEVKRDWFRGAELFDVYTGKGIAEGKRSLALALWFQDWERTLTDTEIDACVAQVVAVVGERTGAQLRR